VIGVKTKWIFTVPCGKGEHEITVTLKRGRIEIFSPCQFLSETARKLAKSNCFKYALERVFELTIAKALKDKNQSSICLKEKKFLTKVGVAIIREGDEYLRYRAIKALGEIGSPFAVGLFVEALKDENRWVRYAAAEALGKIGDARVIKPLVDALKDEYRWVRYAAAKALKRIKYPEAIEKLTEALREDEFIRKAIEDAFISI